MIAQTPEPPYYAVIFTSIIEELSDEEYQQTAQKMVDLASKQEGFLGLESARNELGITVSYWKDEASIVAWKKNWEHQMAQKKGREEWYKKYTVRISKVERAYGSEHKAG
jgi:heme-degrading monooxygenase HmoA